MTAEELEFKFVALIKAMVTQTHLYYPAEVKELVKIIEPHKQAFSQDDNKLLLTIKYYIANSKRWDYNESIRSIKEARNTIQNN